MTRVSDGQLLTQTDPENSVQRSSQTKAGCCSSYVNVGKTERQVSLAAGSLAAVLGLARRDIPGLLAAAVGAGLIYRGATGHCHAYEALGLDTSSDGDGRAERHSAQKNGGVHISKCVLVDRSPNELYSFWRKLENLPNIMSHLRSVQVIDDRRSHWVARAPTIAGGQVEWDAEIIEDQPDERIAWRSLPDSGVANQGSVEFKKAPGDRGTYIHVVMDYAPPAGKLGSILTKVFGEDPQSTIREDLRRFKRSMEIGEVLTTEGQPRGSCFAGVGRLMH